LYDTEPLDPGVFAAVAAMLLAVAALAQLPRLCAFKNYFE
jgi:hypothetical protein